MTLCAILKKNKCEKSAAIGRWAHKGRERGIAVTLESGFKAMTTTNDKSKQQQVRRIIELGHIKILE
ncbi:hypothetical protein DP116_06050 [Brasilonema bromeliae SPC951]|uniref:Transposase n=1 Tax=Brasilonema bromeliae SPC951 TaxID=385972 RepID=A0ABX1P3V4_9CYAN|nr:hypothetical protein [Brasilonema bromeliae SPC951]